MIKLYGMGLSNNVSKVRYALNYLGLDYDWEQTDPLKGENQTEAFRAISPTGKIPAIEIDGFKLFESNAINRYLAARHNSPIYPQHLEQRAIVDAWTDFGAIHIGQAVGRVFFNRVLAPLIKAEVDENSLTAGIGFLERFLPPCDRQLSTMRHLAGDAFTLADINLLAVLDPCEIMGFSLEPYPNIRTWRDALKAQDFYQKCYKDYGEFVTGAAGK